MSKPIVAIVGRPNVGKSTLFNVIAGDTISIVKDTPGVTRDRIYADCDWLNMNFTLIDTGGIEPDSKDIILSQMREQAEIAISTADVIIFIVDVRQGLVDSDSKVADLLRKSHKPVVLAVNKVDSVAKYGNDVYEFYNLGIGEPVAVSAASRLGIGDLLDEVVKHFDSEQMEEEEQKGSVFVQFAEDYISVRKAELEREFSFMPDSRCDTPQEFTEELLKYGQESGKNISVIKEGMSPKLMIDGIEYGAYRTSSRFGIVIHCRMTHPEDYMPDGMPEKKYRKYRALSLAAIPVLIFLLLAVIILASRDSSFETWLMVLVTGVMLISDVCFAYYCYGRNFQ